MTTAYVPVFEQERARDVLRLEEEQARADAELLAAISTHVRLRILRRLGRSGVPITQIELAAHFRVNQATLSRHLRILRDAGLVRFEQEGLYRHYTIVAARMRYACDLLCALTPEPE